ncbi:MAG TPA: VOC family protein [Desulfobacteraceae bacterium]|nr:VOC family protein [Desulfobacteraceae bacterium]
MIKRLDHLNIVVSDLKAAQSFFELFGFTEVDASELSGEWISTVVGLEGVVARYVRLALPNTNIKVELIAYDHPSSIKSEDLSKANGIGIRHLAFEVEDIEAEMARLRGHGVQFLSDVFIYEKIGKKLVYFLGPDGILLELAEYPSNR